MKTENGYPLRPIASVIDTAAEKVKSGTSMRRTIHPKRPETTQTTLRDLRGRMECQVSLGPQTST